MNKDARIKELELQIEELTKDKRIKELENELERLKNPSGTYPSTPIIPHYPINYPNIQPQPPYVVWC